MKAAIYHGIRDLRVEDVPEPNPGRGEVKVKVKWEGGGRCSFYSMFLFGITIYIL
jgi:threonine dehydrogenase-like Zn-dependent dehydrogenase